MLGIAALAQLALAEFPSSGQAGGPPWRRWLAQTYPEATLNRIPTDRFVSRVVAHMLAEGERLYQDRFKAPAYIDLTTGADGLVVTAEQAEELITVFVPIEKLTEAEDVFTLHPDIRAIEQIGGGYRIMFKQLLVDDDSISVKLPFEFPEDSEEDLIAILLATIH